MKVLFVSSGNSKFFDIAPFIKGQGDSLIAQGIELKYFTVKGKGYKGYLKNIKRLRSYLNNNQFDIIHAHYSLTAWVVFFAAPFHKKILSLMGSDVHFSGIEGWLNRLILWIQIFCIQVFYRKIIVKSGNLSNQIWRKNISIIPNGVDFELFKPKNKDEARNSLRLSIEKKLILFLANTNDTNKNFILLEKAIPHIKTPDIQLITPYPIKHSLIPDYLSACDVLVLASLHEGSPNVIKEGLACNTKIVSTPCGDVLDQTKGLENVEICDYNPESLAYKIDDILIRDATIDSREKVRGKLDEKIIAKKLIELYITI